MASRFSQFDRRRFLAGMGAAVVGGGLVPAKATTVGQPLPLRVRKGSLAFRTGQAETPTWLLDGPAPVTRFEPGSPLAVSLQNDLSLPVSVNWHGLDGAAAAEPLTALAPLAAGGKAEFTVPLRGAGTFFADVRLHNSEPSRALPFIVEEAHPPEIDRDEVLLLEDIWLRANGMVVPLEMGTKDAAPIYSVNGRILRDIAVHSNERLRLRFINGCQRDVVAIKIEGLEVKVMAIDSQPCEPFPARNSALVLPPGGRSDAFVDVTSLPGSNVQILLHNGKEARPIARLVTSNEAPVRPAPLPPAPPLPTNGLPAQLDLKSAQRFDLAIGASEWTPANALTASPPAFHIKAGRVVVLALTNRIRLPAMFHLHGHHFRLLDRLDDGWKPYWLDTLVLQPDETQRIAFLAEYTGHYLLESAATDWAAPRLLRWYSVE